MDEPVVIRNALGHTRYVHRPANCPNCKKKIIGSRPFREVFVEER